MKIGQQQWVIGKRLCGCFFSMWRQNHGGHLGLYSCNM